MESVSNRLCGRRLNQSTASSTAYLIPIEKVKNGYDYIIRGDKKVRTRIRTYLGSLKYTADEMDHPIRELSGGQKAKVLLLKMSLSDANVLILDEPTRNFSPLSGPVIRKMISLFPGAVISISHDRKYIDEVCTKVYTLTENGLE
ncbi:ATP-binding cassette domain-containing protein [Butyrivibrio sp.]|uniref:ATP-binding cassette domain-containing protein n=1 Tax=Butyrivibrio sp. TaxID=28121 RepID=UPI002ED1C8DA